MKRRREPAPGGRLFHLVAGEVGVPGDGQTSLVYNPSSGELSVDPPSGVNLTSINIDSATGIFTGLPAQNLSGAFDNDAEKVGTEVGHLRVAHISELPRVVREQCAEIGVLTVPAPAAQHNYDTLAAAGVKRLGLAGRITEYLPPDVMLPAVGQGALCIETRIADPVITPLVSALNHAATRSAVLAERAFLARLEGGCQVPIAGHATLAGDRLSMTGLVADLEGQTVVRETLEGPADQAETIGLELAGKLLERGARSILDSLQTELHS